MTRIPSRRRSRIPNPDPEPVIPEPRAVLTPRGRCSAIRAMRILTFVALALAVAWSSPQGTRDGSPEDNLPPGMTRLSHFGERASWSPDGTRIAFMEKSFGDAYEVDVATRNIRLLTHYAHPGFLRVQFLPNGDYFLIGARTFTDISTTRSRDQEMWILKADGKPGDRAVPLDHKISEGVAISRTAMKIAWSNTRGQYPDEFKPKANRSSTRPTSCTTAASRGWRTRRKSFARWRRSARSRRRTSGTTTRS